jgi:uncharacterized protein with LGFP repeats
MSLVTRRSSLLLLFAGLSLAATGRNASAQNLQVGNYHAVNNSTYDKWYENRVWLGHFARSNEVGANAANGTTGTAMGFDKGAVYRIGSGRRNGETHFVNGGIKDKYFQMGTFRSKAGFPIGDAFRISPTAGHTQAFQGGTITWNVQQKVFTFYPYPFGDR